MAVDAPRAKSLFLAASDLADPAERAAYLNRECGGDAELRARVEALLRADDAAPLPPADLGQTVDSDPGQPRAVFTGEYTPQPVEGHAAADAARPATTTDYQPLAGPGAVIAGRYTLVEKIGEGGMGEVWVAKQTEPVKRKVALKLIKAGMDTKAVVQRFEQERQALALMDHPNIARVLDGGMTPTRQPFFVMELVNGLPLTKFCDEAKLGIRERLELFTPICQAVQHAHQKGIVHRDLKPSNILVTIIDGKPVPKVIDFGVAKAISGRLTDESLSTQFGAVVGTLEYMSPEQAGFSGVDIDTRADIYSLGVILYELLTGLRPIDAKRLKKAAITEMIRIIQEEEPAKPSTRLSSDGSLPSLAAVRQMEPKKLMALLRGELDWVVMKCLEKQRDRRYETANALSRDIQRYLADEVVEARPPSMSYRVSKFVRRHRGQVIAASLVLIALVGGIVGTTLGLFEARRQEKIARDETAEKEKANNELAQANDNLLNVGARGLLRPLGGQVQPNQPLPPLNDQEIDALWELAVAPEEGLRLRFVELALDDAALRRRLKDRAPFAFQAAVELDATRRTRVEELLRKRLEARKISPEEKEQVAFCLAHLGSLDRRLARKTADALVQAMSKTTDSNTMGNLAQALSAASAHLEPKEAAQLCGQAAATLLQATSQTADWLALRDLVQGLSAVAARLEPNEAATTLIQAMSKDTGPYAWLDLARAMSAVAARLEPKQAAEVAATLTQAMSKTTGPNAMGHLARGLSVVVARLEPKAATEVAATLPEAMSKTTGGIALVDLARVMSAVAARLEPKEAAEVAATIAQAMSKTTDPNALRNLAQALSALSARLEPKQAAKLCGQPAATIAQIIKVTEAPDALRSLAQGLSALSARLEPKAATEVAATLTQAMSKTTNRDAIVHLEQALTSVAARLESKEAAEVAATLTQAMSKTTDPNALGNLAQALSARLEPREAAEVAATISQAMSKNTDPNALGNLAQALSAVSARLEPKQAAELCGQPAATIAQAMSKNTDDFALLNLARGLSAVSARLEPNEAAKLCGQPAATIAQTIKVTEAPDALRSLARRLSAVSVRLEPKAATEVAATLTQAMSKTTNRGAILDLAQALSAVAARLEPKDAAEVAATLTQTMSKTRDGIALQNLAQALSAVASRLEPKAAAATLTQAMSKNTNDFALLSLARGLSAVSARLEPKEAAEVAAALAQAMSKNSDATSFTLGQSLSAASARLEPREGAAILIQAMSKNTHPSALQSLAQGLSAVLARELPPQTLVDLLKHPFCVGEARRLVLDQLARHYHQPFADQWDLVDYVQEQKLGLDLTTPPARQSPSRR
jgi:serine/threonine protein kinase/pilus assembly protein TadC